MNEQNDITEVIRLPLWKACLDDMLKDGVDYSQTYDAAWFEDKLKCDRHSMKFGLAISEIRRELEKRGWYLSGRGQNGNQFVILPPENNKNVMQSYQRQAVDALKRGVILGTNTRLDSLADADRRKHEAILERMAFKALLMQRSRSVQKAISKHAPKLLQQQAA